MIIFLNIKYIYYIAHIESLLDIKKKRLLEQLPNILENDNQEENKAKEEIDEETSDIIGISYFVHLAIKILYISK